MPTNEPEASGKSLDREAGEVIGALLSLGFPDRTMAALVAGQQGNLADLGFVQVLHGIHARFCPKRWP